MSWNFPTSLGWSGQRSPVAGFLLVSVAQVNLERWENSSSCQLKRMLASVGERCPGQPREVGKFQLVLAEEDVGIQKESMEYMIEERKRGVYNRGNTAAQDSGRIAEA